MFVLEFLFRHKTSLEILSILQGYKIRKVYPVDSKEIPKTSKENTFKLGS